MNPDLAVAFERLVLEHRAAILGHAYRKTRDSHDAEDLAQDAIVRAARGFERFDGDNFRAWTFRIVDRLWLNKLKTDGRTPGLSDRDVDDACESGPGPDAALRAKEIPPEVMEAVRELPFPLARVFLLVDVAGLSQKEVAAAEGWPYGTVQSRLWRARAMLRERLGDYAREEWGVAKIPGDDGG